MDGSSESFAPSKLARAWLSDGCDSMAEWRRSERNGSALAARSDTLHADVFGFLAPEAEAVDFAWPDEDLPSAVERLEKALIVRALARSGGNRAEAARQLGIHRQHLYAKLKRYGLETSAERTDGVRETDDLPADD